MQILICRQCIIFIYFFINIFVKSMIDTLSDFLITVNIRHNTLIIQTIQRMSGNLYKAEFDDQNFQNQFRAIFEDIGGLYKFIKNNKKNTQIVNVNNKGHLLLNVSANEENKTIKIETQEVSVDRVSFLYELNRHIINQYQDKAESQIRLTQRIQNLQRQISKILSASERNEEALTIQKREEQVKDLKQAIKDMKFKFQNEVVQLKQNLGRNIKEKLEIELMDNETKQKLKKIQKQRRDKENEDIEKRRIEQQQKKQKAKHIQNTIIQFATKNDCSNLLQWINTGKKDNPPKVLIANSRQITNIEPLESLTFLTNIHLGKNNIQNNLKPLSNLTSLTTLQLYSNQISDIQPLQTLESLTYLDLYNNKIKDISCLANLKSLKYLHLFDNEIVYIRSLEKLVSLTNLQLHNNKISQVSSLKNLQSLVYLSLYCNKITDVSDLSGLQSLPYLNIHSNKIQDISCLQNLKSLTFLNICGNDLKKQLYEPNNKKAIQALKTKSLKQVYGEWW